MDFDRNDVQMAVLYFLAYCLITSEEEGVEANSARYAFIAASTYRCRLFDDVDKEQCASMILIAREDVINASKLDTTEEEVYKRTMVLEASGFLKTAIATILDYCLFFDEFDDLRKQLILDICDVAEIDAAEVLSSMAGAYNAINKAYGV